jgi:Mrp family chromosome partitioning ATPase
MQNPDPSQSTLIDLLRPVRTRWWIIVAIVAIAVAASLGLALSQKKTYTATASFQFQEESYDFGLVGIAVAPAQTPATLASQAAQRITQPDVAARAKQILGSPLSIGQLASSVTATVDPNASNVHVLATAPTPDGASALANAFANGAVRTANETQRRVYAAAVAKLVRNGRANADPTALKTLRTLAAIAAPAQLTEVATPPGAPSSPRPARDAALAGALGVLVGLLVVYVMDAIDQRLRSTGEVERQFGYDVVGRVREEALGHSPNAGEPDRVVDPADWEQFRILQRNLEFLGSNGGPRTIAVTSAIPEEGKTTVACFVAFASAATGKRTLLIECDLRRPVLAERLGIRSSPGLTDFASGQASPEELLQVVTFQDVMVRNGTGIKQPQVMEPEGVRPYMHQLVCVTAGSSTDHPVEVLGSGPVRQMLEDVRHAYDVVILDTPPLLVVVDTLEVIEKAEAIVVCGRTAKLTRAQARAGKEALRHLSERPIALVVTGIKPSRDSGYSYYGYYTGAKS